MVCGYQLLLSEPGRLVGVAIAVSVGFGASLDR